MKCDPVKTLTGVAHNQPIGEQSRCSDGVHSSSGNFVHYACNFSVPVSHVIRGLRVRSLLCYNNTNTNANCNVQGYRISCDTHIGGCQITQVM